MFGFIRPVKNELRVREVERFKSVYCGLCHAIKERYGIFHTMFLSYDMSFLALLFSSMEEKQPDIQKKRCIASPFIKKNVSSADDGINRAADLSVLLNYHKLCDTITDEKGAKRMAAIFLRQFAKPAYKKVSVKLKTEDEAMRKCLSELSEIEKANTNSLDKPADAFARLMCAMIPNSADQTEKRILEQLFYHTGRWIYIIDACADIKEDIKNDSYNPVKLRFGLENANLERVRDTLSITLERSLIDIYNSFQLLDIYRDRELLENIICLGMPVITKQVLDQTYQRNGGQNRHGSL